MWDTGFRGMNSKIFVNYRRGDAPDSTGRLYDRLEHEFSAKSLFMDVEGHIKPGDDFIDVIREQVKACGILLAVIGPRWMELLEKRKEDSDDFVVLEIQTALESGKRVIPVLVQGAAMPRAEALPMAIRSLTRKNAVTLRHDRFKVDCQGLVDAIKDRSGSNSKPSSLPLKLVADRTLAYGPPPENRPQQPSKKKPDEKLDSSAEVQWYIARDGKQHGPLTDVEMRKFVERKHLRATDLLWRPGFADWKPATVIFPEVLTNKS